MDYGFFAQDNWKISPRLTLELGLRYDYEALPGSGSNATLDGALRGYIRSLYRRSQTPRATRTILGRA